MEAEQAFRDIQDAYEIVGDPEKRSVFDDFGSGGNDPNQQFTNEGDWARYGNAHQVTCTAANVSLLCFSHSPGQLLLWFNFDHAADDEELGQVFMCYFELHLPECNAWCRRVQGRDDIWVIEFYAPWCGACQGYFP